MSESLARIGFIAYIKSNIRVIALFIVGKHKQSTEKRQVSCCKDCARQVSLACRPQFQWGEAYGVSRRERTPVERRALALGRHVLPATTLASLRFAARQGTSVP